MKPEIKYIECKSGHNHNGPAWIGLVAFSKSGRTLYFDGKAFQSLSGTGITGNYYDIGTGEEYWISGPKKDMRDRHVYGSGKILVEERILDDYLKRIGRRELDEKRHSLCRVIEDLPIERVHTIENERSEGQLISDRERFKNACDMSDAEIEHFIGYYEETIVNVHLKTRKHFKQLLTGLKAEREKRLVKANR